MTDERREDDDRTELMSLDEKDVSVRCTRTPWGSASAIASAALLVHREVLARPPLPVISTSKSARWVSWSMGMVDSSSPQYGQ